jgi:hypothetical protein
MFKKSIVMLILPFTINTAAMEKKKSVLSGGSLIKSLGYTKIDDSCARGLRDLCQALYYQNVWVYDSRCVSCKIEVDDQRSEKEKIAESKGMSNPQGILALVRVDEEKTIDAFFSLNLLDNYGISAELQDVFSTFKELLLTNVFLKNQIESPDAEAFYTKLKLLLELESKYLSFKTAQIYALARRELNRLILRFAVKNKDLHGFTKTKDNILLPMTLAQVRSVTQLPSPVTTEQKTSLEKSSKDGSPEKGS